MDAEDLDWAVYATIEEQVEFETMGRDEATTIYSAFSRMFNGRVA